ncbi:MAG: hypothetical protein IPN42_11350 [Methylococcaceae bacterium]|nr:hypothetical protein [Methylococcaceae bacterium]
MPTKSTQLQQKYYPPKNESSSQSQFPSARYFQIHFEHMENQLSETKQCLIKLQQQMADLQSHFAFFTSEIIESKEKK